MPIAYTQPEPRQPAPLSAPMRDSIDYRLQLLRSMLSDRRWSCPPLVRSQLLQVLDSAAGTGSASEYAWMTLAEEIARYLLYRRTGQQESDALEWPRPLLEQRPAMAGRIGA